MRILFDHASPFALSHGGFQIQIEETKSALERIGVNVDYVRWWDSDQRADIIHFFGRPLGYYIDLAHKKGIPVVMSDLLSGLGSRSPGVVALQRVMTRAVQQVLPPAFCAKMAWDAYRKADAIIALTEWEAELMTRVFDAPSERMKVVPNGVSEEFLAEKEAEEVRGPYLVCTATITERKRVLELARAAVQARTPTWIIGKPYAEADPYAQKFFEFAKQHPDIIRYEGPIEDRRSLAKVYRQARGFVLLSTMESLSLSALEAAGCRCPLLLSDLPWARHFFCSNAVYCPPTNENKMVRALREFYDSADRIESRLTPLGWIGVAKRLQEIYESVATSSL